LGLRLSPFLLVRSGAPFDIVTGRDLTGDGIFTARPALITDPLAAGAISSPFGIFNPKPARDATIIPRNYGQAPGYFTLNLRLSKTIGFGGLNDFVAIVIPKNDYNVEIPIEPLSDGRTAIRLSG
jgi:hypothetical protein